MLTGDGSPVPGGRRHAGVAARWWAAERRRTSTAASELARWAGTATRGAERAVLAALLLVLPVVKSAQLVASLDSSEWVAVRQAALVAVLLVWFLVVTRVDRRTGVVDARRAIGLVPAGRGASLVGATVGRVALLAAFLAGFVVAPTWGRVPLVVLSVAGAATLLWVARRTAEPTGRSSAEGALLVTLLPPVVVYAVVGIVLLAGERPSDAHVAEVVRVVLVTAIGEELIYRGLLLALATRVLGVTRAVIVTSVSFGLWHVGDALLASEGSGPALQAVVVLAIVLATAVGGLAFSWSRIRTGSLAGPVLLHTATNLPGIALGLEVDVDDVAATRGGRHGRAW